MACMAEGCEWDDGNPAITFRNRHTTSPFSTCRSGVEPCQYPARFLDRPDFLTGPIFRQE
jgi:hypothetical protein